MTPVLAFDVNETLLDLRALDRHFERVFGDPSLRQMWFAQMLQLAFVGIATGEYTDFTTSQHAALRMLAARRGVDLAADDADAIVGQMSELPAHPDVEPALDRLRGAGYRLATLTNSVAPVAEAQLTHAGIRAYFERALSADAVRRLKPAPEPYRMAAEELGVAQGDICLVAAHPWDVSGALAAGCRAAFIARGGVVPSPIGTQPEIVAPDLAGLADALLDGRKA
jgi:2-haloacid dehalogenase